MCSLHTQEMKGMAAKSDLFLPETTKYIAVVPHSRLSLAVVPHSRLSLAG